MLITDVQVPGRRGLVDVRCAQGVIADIGHSLARDRAEMVIAGAGGALLPGLHDHHIHLFALAAREQSVHCGPPAVCNPAQLARALRSQRGSGWLRGIGYHESVAGELDRARLDELVRDRPLKIQHRSGKLWIVNSLAAQCLALDSHARLPGVELDGAGRPTGRLFRLDQWMRDQLASHGEAALPSLSAVSRQLASFGVTGVTDATPDSGPITVRAFAAAAASGELLQGVRVMSAHDLPESGCESVRRGERKVMLDEDVLPCWDTLYAIFAGAHRQGRGVAVHCVTPAELVLALSVLREVGPLPGDRIEHASLVPADVLPLLREVGVRVVTQPGFVHERGDQYLRAIDAAQHGDLYRCRALLAQGIPLAGSSDAPYGDPDPWVAMRAAVQRSTRAGGALGPEERLSPEQALALFTSAADAPGVIDRTIAPGEAADLCLLTCSWERARLRLQSGDVKATFRRGVLIYHRERLPLSMSTHAIATA